MGAKLTVYWENPPRAGLTIEQQLGRRTLVRRLGPRDLLTVEEAATALRRPRTDVLAAIRAGFLRAQRRGGRIVVSVGTVQQFLREERADIEAARRARGERAIPLEVLKRRWRS